MSKPEHNCNYDHDPVAEAVERLSHRAGCAHDPGGAAALIRAQAEEIKALRGPVSLEIRSVGPELLEKIDALQRQLLRFDSPMRRR